MVEHPDELFVDSLTCSGRLIDQDWKFEPYCFILGIGIKAFLRQLHGYP